MVHDRVGLARLEVGIEPDTVTPRHVALLAERLDRGLSVRRQASNELQVFPPHSSGGVSGFFSGAGSSTGWMPKSPRRVPLILNSRWAAKTSSTLIGGMSVYSGHRHLVHDPAVWVTP